MPKIEERLTALAIALPAPNTPVANYVPFVTAGRLLYISGQVSIDPSGGIKGVVGGRRRPGNRQKSGAALWRKSDRADEGDGGRP